MYELLLAIALYALWAIVPRRAQREALSWFWTVVLLLATAGVVYAIITTGSIPQPALG